MTTMQVLRVFTAEDGTGGNPLGVFVDASDISPARRQSIAAELGFSETVYVDDQRSGRLSIYTPALELPFAGHPLVGTAWLLAQHGSEAGVLRPPAGEVRCWEDCEGRTWIRGRAEWAPPIQLRQLPSPAEVEALRGPPEDLGFVDAWAWEDEAEGRIRARVFAAEAGVFEDEATGAAAVRLVTHLGRPLTIRQGRGSLLHAAPGPGGTAEVGGKVVLDRIEEHDG